MLKVLFVSHSSVVEYHQQKLCVMAEKFGVKVILVTPPYWPEGGTDVRVFTGNNNITYETGKAVIIKKRFVHFYLNVSGMIRKHDPDIVYIEEEPFVPACMQFMKAAKKLGKKAVFFTWENINRKYNPVYNSIEKYCLQNAHAAVAGNNEAMEILRLKGMKVPVEVIPQYGLNMADFKPCIGFGTGIKEIVYIGRITPEKGIDTLLRAAANVPDINVNLIGTGSAEYTKQMQQLAFELKITDRVKFHGHMNRQALNEFLPKMQVLVLPSVTTPGWKEQFGRVLIEAFASKIAVIGSSSGEIPFVISDTGLVFKEGNAQDLAGAINKIKNDKFIFEKLTALGYKRVAENYTNEIIAEKIVKLCRGLLQ